MDTVAQPFTTDARPTARTLLHWLSQAWLLFRQAPVRLFLLSLVPIVVEILIQLVPVAGIAASKLLTPLASAWVLAMLHQKASTGTFATANATASWFDRLKPLLLVALIAVVVFGFQLLVAAALAGVDSAVAMATADAAGLSFSKPEFACILASGSLAVAPLMFVMPRVLLDHVGVVQAIGESVRYVIRYWRPVMALALLSGAMVAGLLWVLPLLLILLPFGMLVGYTAYRDVFHRTGRD